MKIRREVLTLKCNSSSLKICGALWDNGKDPPVEISRELMSLLRFIKTYV